MINFKNEKFKLDVGYKMLDILELVWLDMIHGVVKITIHLLSGIKDVLGVKNFLYLFE